ncbi:VOC family protein [Nonomuraea rhizosphaerae]|uniref:VOC family protein n=1 Tax=Nonomuraea rhizosphaerae TaxID=2665663 RepID=UPI001C5D554E|nr:VOC family protein [Nonomuraea rhizosphaerae]
MALSISQVSIYVADQQRAVDFWTQKMGFAVTRDMPYGEDRWIEVEPPGGGSRIVLAKAGPGSPELATDGPPSYVLFHDDDIVKTYEELSGRGVEFTMAPKQEHWGWSAVFRDDYGHLFHLSQR